MVCAGMAVSSDLKEGAATSDTMGVMRPLGVATAIETKRSDGLQLIEAAEQFKLVRHGEGLARLRKGPQTRRIRRSSGPALPRLPTHLKFNHPLQTRAHNSPAV